MTPRRTLALALMACALATPAAADCRVKISGAKCVAASRVMQTPVRYEAPKVEVLFSVGDSFPVYEHSMLLNPERYGLPAVTGNWRYYRVSGVVYQVDPVAGRVIGVVGGVAS